MKTYACVYFGAALLAMFIMPLVTRFARSMGLVDKPGVRKVHTSPVPRVGGIVIILGTLMLTLPVFVLDNEIGDAFRRIQPKIIMLLTAGVFLFIVGLLDDVRSISSKVKLICLLGASLSICLSGARIETIAIDGLFELHLGAVSWPVTILWIVGVTVGMNFIDGLDGLAAGIAAIVCGVITVMAFYSQQYVMAVLMLGLLGSLTGFLFFNWNPAKIFMGDCGSLFVGFMVAAGSVVAVAKTSTFIGITMPALALGVPLLDTFFTVIRRRVLDRRSVFAAERGHIHHRLLDMGLNQRRAVAFIYAATLLLSAGALGMLLTRSTGTIVLFVGMMAFLLMLFHIAGSARLGDLVAALKRNSAIAQQAKHDRGCFEDVQLRMREATTFEQWWGAICELAGSLEFERVALTLVYGSKAGQSTVWRRNSDCLLPTSTINLVIPIGAETPACSLRLEVAARVDGSLEGFGRRVMFLGRLIDEHGVKIDPHQRDISVRVLYTDITDLRRGAAPAPGGTTHGSA